MVALIVVVSGTLIGLDYHRSRLAALTDAERSMHVFSERLVDRLGVMSADAVTPVELIGALANAFVVPPPERMKDKSAILRVALLRSPEIDGIYAGYPDGTFFHGVSLRSQGWRKALAAPEAAAVALRSIEKQADGDRTLRVTFVDAAGAVISEVASPASTYDPRSRPWYRAAVNALPIVSIGPYQMATTGALGMTVAQAHRQKTDVVIGADVILDTIADFLSSNRITPGTIALIVDGTGKVIIHSDPGKMTYGADGRDDVAPPPPEPIMESIGDLAASSQHAKVVEVDGRRHLVVVAQIDAGVLLKRNRIVVAAPLDELLKDANRALLQGLAVSAAVVLAAALLALLLAGWVTRSLLHLTTGANRLQTLDFSTPINTSSHVREISSLGAAMNRARNAIHTFAMYVPKEFVRTGIETGHFTGRSARRQEVTALFTDIYDFTTISENFPPEAVVAMLSDYFDVFGEVVTAHNGTIIQFLGDSVYAMWNAPIPDDDHAADACRCAFAVEKRLADFNRAQIEKGLPEFKTRYGIHSGPAVVGSVGASERLQYTAMGDTINVASRLEGMNKSLGTSMIASAATVERCAGAIIFRALGSAQAKGRSESLELYEILGIAGCIGHPEPA